MRIYLTGFMGAGKTTVGSILAERLGFDFVDLDAEIERSAGSSVRELFAGRGEAAFRVLEHHALAATLQRDDVVVATGGGTLTFAANRELIGSRGWIVWLNASFDTIRGRIGSLGKGDRPLFRDEQQAWELYQARLPAYRGADATVDIGAGDQPQEVARRIELMVRSTA